MNKPVMVILLDEADSEYKKLNWKAFIAENFKYY